MVNILNETVETGDKLRIGYGPERSLTQGQNQGQWGVCFPKSSRAVLDLAQEGILTAKSLYARYREPLYVFYSGGIDSEFTLHCFMRAEVPFKVVTCEFSENVNDHDMKYVNAFKEKFPLLDYVSHVLNIKNFLNSAEAIHYAEISRCTLPHLLSLMWLMDRTDAPLVVGSGEPFLEPYSNHWCLKEREAIAGIYRYFHLKQKKGTPVFFQENAEIFLSFLKDPIVMQLVSGKRGARVSSMTSKIDIYSRHFEIERREKYHGFEKIENVVAELQNKLELKFPENQNTQYWKHEALLEAL